MKFLLDIAKMKTIDLECQNKLLLQKTNEILSEWKNDFTKLIDVVKEKEKNIEFYEMEMVKKKFKIESLEDRLISVSIFEKKIKFLQENFDRETQKMIKIYENKLKEISDPYKIAPNLIKFKEEKESEVLKIEMKNNSIQKELIKSMNSQRQTEKDFSFKIKKMKLDSEDKASEIIRLREKIAEQSKECQISQIKRFFSRI